MNIMLGFWLLAIGITFGGLISATFFAKAVRRNRRLRRNILAMGSEGEKLLYGVLAMNPSQVKHISNTKQSGLVFNQRGLSSHMRTGND